MAYHVSKDGISRQCKAKSPESCTATPSDQKEHYDTKEEAQKAYERKEAKNTFKPLKNSERHYENLPNKEKPRIAQKKNRDLEKSSHLLQDVEQPSNVIKGKTTSEMNDFLSRKADQVISDYKKNLITEDEYRRESDVLILLSLLNENKTVMNNSFNSVINNIPLNISINGFDEFNDSYKRSNEYIETTMSSIKTSGLYDSSEIQDLDNKIKIRKFNIDRDALYDFQSTKSLEKVRVWDSAKKKEQKENHNRHVEMIENQLNDRLETSKSELPGKYSA